MESAAPATSLPSAPEGYVYAGPVSDFILSPSDGSTASDASADEPLAAGCQTACSPERKTAEDGEEYIIKVVEIPQPAGRYPPQRRVGVSYFRKKWYAFINICPHQGSALSRGSMMDIEDMGIVWGAGITCSLHNWMFDAQSGQSDSTRFVIDTYNVMEVDGHVFVSQEPRNGNVLGPRRDFGGREMN